MNSSETRRDHWAGLVSAQQSSGLPAARWCRDNNIEANNFYNWRKRLSSSSSVTSSEPTAGQWLALGATGQNSRSVGLTLRVGCVSIDVTPGFDRYLLLDILGVVQSAC